MIFRILITLAAFFAASCVSSRLNQRLGDAMGDINQARGELHTQQHATVEPLTWKQAGKLLEERNLTLIRSNARIQELEKERKSYLWRQFAPRLSAAANLSSGLSALSSLSSSDAGVNLLSSVSIPSPIGLYAQRYALELNYYQTKLDHALVYRRLYASLYGNFLQQQILEQGLHQSNLETNNKSTIFSLVQESYRKDIISIQNQARLSRLRIGLNQLLDTPGKNWHAEYQTLPNISYAKRLDKLDPKYGFGKIALQQAAGQTEAALASFLQVKLDILPSLSTSVAMPSLYSSQNDSNNVDLGDSNLFLGLNKSVEFTGQRARSVERAKEYVYFAQRTIRHRLESEMVNLNQLRQQYRLLLKEQERQAQHLQWLKNNPPSGASQLLEHVENLRKENQLPNQLTSNGSTVLDLGRKTLEVAVLGFISVTLDHDLNP
jgi:hypothetical protein